ncbi:MAG: hypothetical protein JNK70_01040 [Phycisphaerae bacterium]|nr:hypothetical protein [Phycisphaerae bacterium]
MLWHPRGKQPDSELVETLRTKGFRTIECDSPVEATSWVCSTAIPAAGFSKAGRCSPDPIQPVVFLLDRPTMLLGISEVRQALDRYAPGAAIWVHDPGGVPRLSRYPAAEPIRRAAPPGPVGDPGTTLRLALTSDPQDDDAGTPVDLSFDTGRVPTPEVGTFERATAPRDLLTDEELSMLLDGPLADPPPFNTPRPRP